VDHPGSARIQEETKAIGSSLRCVDGRRKLRQNGTTRGDALSCEVQISQKKRHQKGQLPVSKSQSDVETTLPGSPASLVQTGKACARSCHPALRQRTDSTYRINSRKTPMEMKRDRRREMMTTCEPEIEQRREVRPCNRPRAVSRRCAMGSGRKHECKQREPHPCPRTRHFAPAACRPRSRQRRTLL
jgi:hypothetical protein